MTVDCVCLSPGLCCMIAMIYYTGRYILGIPRELGHFSWKTPRNGLNDWSRFWRIKNDYLNINELWISWYLDLEWYLDIYPWCWYLMIAAGSSRVCWPLSSSSVWIVWNNCPVTSTRRRHNLQLIAWWVWTCRAQTDMHCRTSYHHPASPHSTPRDD